jgi:hypothetical protein
VFCDERLTRILLARTAFAIAEGPIIRANYLSTYPKKTTLPA